MEIEQYQQWIRQFYQQRSWYDYSPFIRMNFLAEEVGEIAQAVRKLEIGRDRPDEIPQSEAQLKQELMSELGDALDNLLILADLYGFSMQEVMQQHQAKLWQRYPDMKESLPIQAA